MRGRGTDSTLPFFTIGAAVVVGMLVCAAGWVSTASADDGDGSNLVVSVISSSASPTGTATSTATSSSTSATSANDSSTTSGDTSSTGTAGGTSTPTATTSQGSDGPAGLLYVSGLSYGPAASASPLTGAVELRFTVRNVSTTTVDATATFWATTLFGSTIGSPVVVPVAALKSQESRMVSATLPGVAAWVVVTGHVTFTPPPLLDGVPLTPTTREVTAWFVPWPMLLLVGVGVGSWLWLRRRRSLGRAGEQP